MLAQLILAKLAAVEKGLLIPSPARVCWIIIILFLLSVHMSSGSLSVAWLFNRKKVLVMLAMHLFMATCAAIAQIGFFFFSFLKTVVGSRGVGLVVSLLWGNDGEKQVGRCSWWNLSNIKSTAL